MKYTILFFVVFLFVSCSESFFDRYPIDDKSEESFYADEQSMEYALNATYSALRGFYNNYYIIGDLAADNVFNEKYNNQTHLISINESNVDPTNQTISSLWTNAYKIINRANITIEKLKKLSLSDSFVDACMGEALFLRSLVYFDLVRIFGDVPLVLYDLKTVEDIINANVRTSTEFVYEQIIVDLRNSIQLLEKNVCSDLDQLKGRVTPAAAHTLLAKVYLTLGMLDDSKSELTKVLELYPTYHLLPRYKDVFSALYPNNDEIIFAVQYARGFDPGMGNPLQQSAFPNLNVGNNSPLLPLKNGGGNMLMTDDLYNQFEKGDQRLETVCNSISVEGRREPYIFTTKYFDETQTDVVESGCDIILLRYADVVLMLAEIEARQGNVDVAFSFLKEVRDRAGLVSSELLKSDILNSILKERRLEFYCEGHRWFDLLRFGVLKDVMNSHFKSGVDSDQIGTGCIVEDYELLFPIPKYEIDLSNGTLTQNPGYAK